MTVIDASAFFGCTSLRRIPLPPNLPNIGYAALKNFTSLKEAQDICLHVFRCYNDLLTDEMKNASFIQQEELIRNRFTSLRNLC